MFGMHLSGRASGFFSAYIDSGSIKTDSPSKRSEGRFHSSTRRSDTPEESMTRIVYVLHAAFRPAIVLLSSVLLLLHLPAELRAQGIGIQNGFPFTADPLDTVSTEF